MTTQREITPTTQILDSQGRDWAWAYRIFRPIPGLNGYLCDSDGGLWSSKKWRWADGNAPKGLVNEWHKLKGVPNTNGYLSHNLMIGKKQKLLRVHAIVLETFIGPRPESMLACHNNGNRTDNRLRNLRWDSHRANIDDATRHGTWRYGSSHPMALLEETQVAEILQLLAEGGSVVKIATTYGVKRDTIASIKRGRSWKHIPRPLAKEAG
jgi:hypothetical protein